MSINIKQAKSYCCEDISLIENYEEALADKTQTWICHHRLGIELNKTPDELKAMGLYENRPACELMFLTEFEHKSLHAKQYWTQDNREKQSEKMKDKIITEEQRKKCSIAAKKRWESQDEREKQSKRRKGKKDSNETRAKKSASKKGLKLSEEHRKHISEARKKYWEEWRKKNKKRRQPCYLLLVFQILSGLVSRTSALAIAFKS